MNFVVGKCRILVVPDSLDRISIKKYWTIRRSNVKAASIFFTGKSSEMNLPKIHEVPKKIVIRFFFLKQIVSFFTNKSGRFFFYPASTFLSGTTNCTINGFFFQSSARSRGINNEYFNESKIKWVAAYDIFSRCRILVYVRERITDQTVELQRNIGNIASFRNFRFRILSENMALLNSLRVNFVRSL